MCGRRLFPPKEPTMKRFLWLIAIGALGVAPAPARAQRGGQRDTMLVHRRDSLEKALEAIAVIDRKLMIPMRDGKRMQFDVYRPRNASGGGVPAIFVRTPYNMNFWDVNLGAPADMTAQLEAVKRGYAYV